MNFHQNETLSLTEIGLADISSFVNLHFGVFSGVTYLQLADGISFKYGRQFCHLLNGFGIDHHCHISNLSH